MSEYLSQQKMVSLKDYQINPDIKEYQIWTESAAKLMSYISEKMWQNEMHSKMDIRNNIIKETRTLYSIFKNVTGKDLYITQYKKESIQNFLKNSYKTYSAFYSYNSDIFTKLLKLEYFLLISKNQAIYKGQFNLVAFYLLFQYFKPWEKDVANNWQDSWTVPYNEINNIVFSILDMNLQELLNDEDVKSIREKLQIDNALKEAYKTKMTILEPEIKYLGKKPLAAECLTDLWKGQDNELTQSQKLDLVMLRYGCSKSAATSYMKKFGLWQYRGQKTSELDEKDALIEALQNRIKELEEIIKAGNVQPKEYSFPEEEIMINGKEYTEDKKPLNSYQQKMAEAQSLVEKNGWNKQE